MLDFGGGLDNLVSGRTTKKEGDKDFSVGEVTLAFFEYTSDEDIDAISICSLIKDPKGPCFGWGFFLEKGFSNMGKRFTKDDSVRGMLFVEAILVGDEGIDIIYIF